MFQYQNIGEPIKSRRLEYELRPSALEDFAVTLQLTQKAIDQYHSGDERYSHLTESEMQKVCTSFDSMSKWLQEKRTELASCPRPSDPPITVSQIRQEKSVSMDVKVANIQVILSNLLKNYNV